jgi:hypothetical protein
MLAAVCFEVPFAEPFLIPSQGKRAIVVIVRQIFVVALGMRFKVDVSAITVLSVNPRSFFRLFFETVVFFSQSGGDCGTNTHPRGDRGS